MTHFFTNKTEKNAVHNAKVKIAVIDLVDQNDNPWPMEDIFYMRNHDSPKLIVGELKSFDIDRNSWYWKKEWKTQIIPWLVAGKIIIEQMVKAGFDGIYVEDDKYDNDIIDISKKAGSETFMIYRKKHFDSGLKKSNNVSMAIQDTPFEKTVTEEPKQKVVMKSTKPKF